MFNPRTTPIPDMQTFRSVQEAARKARQLGFVFHKYLPLDGLNGACTVQVYGRRGGAFSNKGRKVIVLKRVVEDGFQLFLRIDGTWE